MGSRLTTAMAVLYRMHIYRLHMRAVHIFGGHNWETVGPMLGDGNDPRDGQRFDRCGWCGATKNTEAFDASIARARAKGWTLEGGWPASRALQEHDHADR